MLICSICNEQFQRKTRRGPIPRYCSQRCATKSKRTPSRIEYERNYKRQRRSKGLDLPDNVERRAYFRERWRRIYGDKFSGLTIQNPYTGHRWFDIAQAAVGRIPAPEYRDFGYYDEVGEALLALLEGNDPAIAVRKYRTLEYIPRHLTIFTSDWHDNEDSIYLPSVPSAEEEVVALSTIVSRPTIKWGNNRRKFGNNRGQQQPRRRRAKDGKSWKKHK